MLKKLLLSAVFIGSLVQAQQTYKSPLTSAIKESDLKKDLYAMADNHFRGREAGTLDELKAAVWLADEAKKAGMQPAGDDGTFFQFFHLIRHRPSDRSTISINGKGLALWSDVLIAQPNEAIVDAPIVFIDKGRVEDLEKADLKGKAVAIMASDEGLNLNMSLPERRYPVFVRNKFYEKLTAKGAVAIIFIADKLGEESWPAVVPQMTRGLYDIAGGINEKISPKAPVIWVHEKELDALKKAGSRLTTNIITETFCYPSVNVIGKIVGTDSKLNKEYVLISGHHDHEGILQKYGEDSIYNGADDNASVCVAMLAMARAYKIQPAKRSLLFVFHGSEERGLLGSKYHAAHPVVDKSSIIAVLNGDMIGRNDVNEATILGANDPHKNSDDLVEITLRANEEGPKFRLNKDWDKPEHVEYFYFRSDHLPYAKTGIPAIFFTSMLHSQYHTPMDKPENINYLKLKKMTDWIYRTSWILANEKERPALVTNFKLER